MTKPDSDIAEGRAPVLQPWTWLLTHDGAVRRNLVTSFYVERSDGDFGDDVKCTWTVNVMTSTSDEPVALRLIFTSATELCGWVDKVFPGACFTLLPPVIVTEAPQVDLDLSGARLVTQGAHPGFAAGNIGVGGSGHATSDAVRQIGDQLLTGHDTYTPDQYNRPRPNEGPRPI